MNKTNDILPEKNVLLTEMIHHLSVFYFPTSFEEEAIQELLKREFSMVKRHLCQLYRSDENEYISKGRISPFEVIRKEVEQEIRKRIRKDNDVLRIAKVRDSMISSIKEAVKKANGCIGTFYANVGEHHRDANTNESDWDSVGTYFDVLYVSASICNKSEVDEILEDIYFNEAEQLLCTIDQGEKDCDIPIEDVDTESLKRIVIWLKEQSFLPDEDESELVCEECGSLNVQEKAWVAVNEDNAYVEGCSEDDDDRYCEECQEHVDFCTRKEFEEEMDERWKNATNAQKENITHLRLSDFDTPQVFVSACDNYWNNLSYNEKRKKI